MQKYFVEEKTTNEEKPVMQKYFVEEKNTNEENATKEEN